MVWVAADWGTTHLDLWVMEDDGRVRTRIESDEGMGVLAPEDYEPTLLGLLRDHLPADRTTEVLAAGMVGARQGWIEAPYAPVPARPPLAAEAVRAATRDRRLSVHVLPGMSQAEPPDVMRGEEVRIAGVFATEPGFDGVICLPGRYTKWVQVSAGEVVSFRSFMTGELMALLTETSVLRMSVAARGWNAEAFAEGLDRALAKPEALAAGLFSLRAEALLRDLSPEAARARLAGLLVGAELAAARAYWLGQDIRVVGRRELATVYEAAVARQGGTVTRLDGEGILLAGFRAAHAALDPAF